MIVRVYQVVDVEIPDELAERYNKVRIADEDISELDVEVYETALNMISKDGTSDISNITYGAKRFVYFQDKQEAGDPCDVEIKGSDF